MKTIIKKIKIIFNYMNIDLRKPYNYKICFYNRHSFFYVHNMYIENTIFYVHINYIYQINYICDSLCLFKCLVRLKDCENIWLH